jgi:hypothetical protein
MMDDIPVDVGANGQYIYIYIWGLSSGIEEKGNLCILLHQWIPVAYLVISTDSLPYSTVQYPLLYMQISQRDCMR